MAGPLLVADTDLAIDYLRDRGPGAEAIDRWITDGRLRLTAITAFELMVGVRDPDRLAAILADRTIALDVPSALRAGEVFAGLRAGGVGVDVKDALIAGICLRHGLPLATRNVRHFARIPGLVLEKVS